MHHRYLEANPQLKDYIRTILVLEHSPAAGNSDLPLYTRGMSALLCRVENDDHHITLFGQSVPDEAWTAGKNGTLIAFFFRPFALAPAFKLSAKELKEKPAWLDLWHPQKAMALYTQLLHAGSTAEKIGTLEHFILAQIEDNRRECEIIKYATDKMTCDPGTEVLSGILDDLGLNERTFQRMFRKYVGITPGQFRRICQFQASFAQLRTGQFHTMAEVVYDNGFADQSHFIRAFREFLETTPNSYLRFGLKKKDG